MNLERLDNEIRRFSPSSRTLKSKLETHFLNQIDNLGSEKPKIGFKGQKKLQTRAELQFIQKGLRCCRLSHITISSLLRRLKF